MGGVLPELADPTALRRVLDVGCGTGGWLMETARTYPSIKKLVGVDTDSKMVAYAQEEAEASQLDRRVQFQTMDALQMLDFSEASFDLVNQRLGQSWLRTWEWKNILLKYQWVTRPGGIIRITEYDNLECNSPALTKLFKLLLEAGHRSWHLFDSYREGLAREQVRLMTEWGLQDVKYQVHTLVYSAGTERGQHFYEAMAHFFRVTLPFLQKWTDVPSDYLRIYEQALQEMLAADFIATGTWLTACGIRSRNQGFLPNRKWR
jgi:ubiquinone/menaquinone biosynthesis C-methylase UbiE